MNETLSTPAPPRQSALTSWARRWVWALPVWGVLLGLSTLTHQPDYKTDFQDYAEYVTT